MPIWIIAAIGSVAITAVLTFALWRMNQPMLERNKREAEGGDGGPMVVGDGGRRDADYGTDDAGSSGSSDGGGGDGGGD